MCVIRNNLMRAQSHPDLACPRDTVSIHKLKNHEATFPKAPVCADILENDYMPTEHTTQILSRRGSRAASDQVPTILLTPISQTTN